MRDPSVITLVKKDSNDSRKISDESRKISDESQENNRNGGGSASKSSDEEEHDHQLQKQQKDHFKNQRNFAGNVSAPTTPAVVSEPELQRGGGGGGKNRRATDVSTLRFQEMVSLFL